MPPEFENLVRQHGGRIRQIARRYAVRCRGNGSISSASFAARFPLGDSILTTHAAMHQPAYVYHPVISAQINLCYGL